LKEAAQWWGVEAAVKASLLMALVFILAHLSSQKLLPLAHEGPSPASDVLAEIVSDRADTRAKRDLAAYCSVALRNRSLNQGCPVGSCSSEDCLTKEYPAGIGMSMLIDNLEVQAAPPSRATRTKCNESNRHKLFDPSGSHRLRFRQLTLLPLISARTATG
jgi:hypothetical protein